LSRAGRGGIDVNVFHGSIVVGLIAAGARQGDDGDGDGRPSAREARPAFWYGRRRAAMPTATSPAVVAVDSDVIDRFCGGDRDGFLAIHDAHAAAIARLIARFFPRPFEREEATQEVWLLVHRMAGSFDPARGALPAWLRVVASNRCREMLRAQGRRVDARADVASLDDLVDGDDPETSARLGRLRAAVARFSAALSPEETIELRMSLLEERPHEEVAAETGASVRRCKYLRKKLLARAVADPALRAVLEEVVGS
jgi:RNA polymerase sigma factor (sigma-70 family)